VRLQTHVSLACMGLWWASKAGCTGGRPCALRWVLEPCMWPIPAGQKTRFRFRAAVLDVGRGVGGAQATPWALQTHWKLAMSTCGVRCTGESECGYFMVKRGKTPLTAWLKMKCMSV
jgi:hypothetical protein